MSWLLASQVIGLSTIVFRRVCGSGVSPWLFLFTAVPWPTVVERPVIRGLSAFVTGGTTEALGWFGFPSVLRGNIIETAHGQLSVAEGCSGIRSLQVSLMLALFFGALYRLSLSGRLICILTAFGSSLSLNMARTFGFSLLTIRKGAATAGAYHDLLGIPITLGCFVCVWLIARWLAQPRPDRESFLANTVCLRSIFEPVFARDCPRFRWFVLPLLIWVTSAEIGTRLWYRLHEARLPSASTWHIELSNLQRGYRDHPISAQARQILRFDEGLNVSWFDNSDFQWQAIFLRWERGRTASYLARNHTPADCLPASGFELVRHCEPLSITVNGIELPFRGYAARTEQGPMWVFYCLWEDRAVERAFAPSWLTYRERIAAVFAGRRNCGQRSLEIAVWGPHEPAQAESALREVVTNIVKAGT